jgi:hypothetical protein
MRAIRMQDPDRNLRGPGPVSAEECNNMLSVVFLIRIHIDLALLDPDPGAGNLPKLTDKPDFQSSKNAFVRM